MRFPVAAAALARSAALLGAAAALAACTMVRLGPPHQLVSEFTTNQTVLLRAGEADDSAIVAILPKGTPVRLDGRIGSECVCWRVDTPAGTGWVYTRYLQIHFADIGR